MSEITKLYENAKIEKRLLCGDRDVLCGHVRPDGKSRMSFGCFGCEYKNDEYPPFTAEKQLKLIKWLANLDICLNFYDEEFYLFTMNLGGHEKGKDFLNVLAKYINNRWTNFDEEEKEQIREILKRL